MKPRDTRFLRFAGVGVVGFAIDGGVLSALMAAGGLGPYSARLVSFTLAVTATWWLNRHLTFREAPKNAPGRQYAIYIAVQVAGALSNLAVFALLIETLAPFARLPILALAAGAVVGLCINYAGSRHLAFATPRQPSGRAV